MPMKTILAFLATKNPSLLRSPEFCSPSFKQDSKLSPSRQALNNRKAMNLGHTISNKVLPLDRASELCHVVLQVEQMIADPLKGS